MDEPRRRKKDRPDAIRTVVPDEIVQDGKRIGRYRRFYSAERLQAKVRRALRAAGERVIYLALLLHELLKDPDVPVRAKTMITGALGYFILPFDFVPDILPVVGFGEDAGILLAVLFEVQRHLTSAMRERARNRVRDLFGAPVPDESFERYEQDEKR